MVAMPDHGEINPKEDLAGFNHIYSGHFHKRQTNGNVTYLGNCFPHNYADAGDDDRGLMVLEWGKDPVYHAWPDQPRYRVYNLSDVINHTEKMLHPNMHVRVELDIDISYEEATFIKETFIDTYQLRELKLIPVKADEIMGNIAPGQIAFESIDTIVHNQLNALEAGKFNPTLLSEIYRNL
jgi:hypothetical protein